MITILLDCSKLGITNKCEAFNQLVIECRCQIQRFLSAFPDQQLSFQLDSHQHVHAVPIVYKALAQALAEENCLVRRLREPIDPLSLYRTYGEGDAKGIRQCAHASNTRCTDAHSDGKSRKNLLDICPLAQMPSRRDSMGSQQTRFSTFVFQELLFLDTWMNSANHFLLPSNMKQLVKPEMLKSYFTLSRHRSKSVLTL